LNGGKEKPLNDDDIGLQQHWSSLSVINHTVTMTSLTLEYLAENDSRITFLHASPGFVRSDIFDRLTAPEDSGIAWRMALAVICGFVKVIMMLVGISVEESGERHAFHLTSDRYGPGAWRVDPVSDLVEAPGVLERYREAGWRERVWEHTMGVFDKALATVVSSVPD